MRSMTMWTFPCAESDGMWPGVDARCWVGKSPRLEVMVADVRDGIVDVLVSLIRYCYGIHANLIDQVKCRS
jgi:hypothetical protein